MRLEYEFEDLDLSDRDFRRELQYVLKSYSDERDSNSPMTSVPESDDEDESGERRVLCPHNFEWQKYSSPEDIPGLDDPDVRQSLQYALDSWTGVPTCTIRCPNIYTPSDIDVSDDEPSDPRDVELEKVQAKLRQVESQLMDQKQRNRAIQAELGQKRGEVARLTQLLHGKGVSTLTKNQRKAANKAHRAAEAAKKAALVARIGGANHGNRPAPNSRGAGPSNAGPSYGVDYTPLPRPSHAQPTAPAPAGPSARAHASGSNPSPSGAVKVKLEPKVKVEANVKKEEMD